MPVDDRPTVGTQRSHRVEEHGRVMDNDDGDPECDATVDHEGPDNQAHPVLAHAGAPGPWEPAPDAAAVGRAAPSDPGAPGSGLPPDDLPPLPPWPPATAEPARRRGPARWLAAALIAGVIGGAGGFGGATCCSTTRRHRC